MDLSKYTVMLLPITEIFADLGWNCRPVPRDECLSLARSIKEKGLDVPIIVRPMPENAKGQKYKIVAGHRRYTAFQINGMDMIPAVVRTDLDDETAKDLNLTENLERKDLTFIQQARALKYYFDKGYSDEQVASRLSCSNGWVTPRRRVLDLPGFVQRECETGVLTQGHIGKLWIFRNNPEQMASIVRQIKEGFEQGQKAIPIKDKVTIESLAKIVKPQKYQVDDMLDWFLTNLTERLPKGESREVGSEHLAHRVLAWAGGYCSEGQLWRSIERECNRLEIPFNPPTSVKEVLESCDA